MKLRLPFLVIYLFLVSKGNLYRFDFTAADVKCPVAAVKSLPVLPRNAVLIRLGITELIPIW